MAYIGTYVPCVYSIFGWKDLRRGHGDMELCFRDIYASTTCFFVSSTLQMERGVFNCLSEAKRTQFLTRKRSFFGRFFMKNFKLWYIWML